MYSSDYYLIADIVRINQEIFTIYCSRFFYSVHLVYITISLKNDMPSNEYAWIFMVFIFVPVMCNVNCIFCCCYFFFRIYLNIAKMHTRLATKQISLSEAKISNKKSFFSFIS